MDQEYQFVSAMQVATTYEDMRTIEGSTLLSAALQQAHVLYDDDQDAC